MKVAIRILALVMALCIIAMLGVASYSKWFNYAAEKLPSPYRYGDLYFFSNNPDYRIKIAKELKIVPVKPISNLRLTIIADSYFNGSNKDNYAAEFFDHIDWNNIPDTIAPLQTGNKNILIIETTERHARWRLKTKNLISMGVKNIPTTEYELKLAAEDNLQYLFTNFNFLLNLKELKSTIYLKLFNRYDKRVAEPNKCSRLFLNETVDESSNSSSYNDTDDKEIEEIVNSLNQIHDDALKMGYEDVYFSIIPNAASIYNYNGKKYNHLIERIQNNPNLIMPFINTYQLLKGCKENVFHLSDSHWNSLGHQLWINEVNKIVKSSKK
jgi:hypothetical protein